jgi:hypothetical protein
MDGGTVLAKLATAHRIEPGKRRDCKTLLPQSAISAVSKFRH